MANDNDNVVRPAHYKQGKIETIDIIKAKTSPEEFKGFLKGNIIKYITRAAYKNGIEDYEKAQWYLKYLIKVEKESAQEVEDNGSM